MPKHGFVFALISAVVLLVAGSAVADGPEDKVHISSVDVQPGLLILGETRAAATARVLLEPADGLAATDNKQKPSHRFYLELRWEFTDQQPALVTRTTTDVAPPYRYSGPSIDVAVTSSFDGSSGGQRLTEGRRPYRISAYLWRQSLNASEQTKLVGSSEFVTGSLLVSSRPAPPSVDPYPSTTAVPVITLTGRKPAFTSLLVSGVERVALSAATTWSTTKTLVDGVANVILISDRNAVGLESLPVTVTVTLRSTPPAPPVVSVVPAYTNTNSRTVALSGTKEPGTAILVDSVVRVPLDSSTTWSVTIQLDENENRFVIEAQDAAGNRSRPAGSHTAGIATDKPVVRDLVVEPAELAAGQTAQVRYRLFAAVPPIEQADLRVHVRVEDGDRLVAELFSGIQQGSPDGPTFTATWNGTDLLGHAVLPNATYRIVVSADRVAPTTRSRELVDANPKESAVVVVGSRHVTSPDRKLEVVFRPDDANLAIEAYPVLTPLASRLLTSRKLHPIGCYRVRVTRPLAGSTVGVLTCAGADGRLLRPFWWIETQQDWRPIGRSNWNSSLHQLSFVLPGPGLVVFATTDDVDHPYVTGVKLEGSRFTARVRDDSSGVDIERMRVRQAGKDVSARIGQRLLNGVHDVELTLDGVESLESLTVYLEDWAGHGRLFLLGERKAP